MNSPTLLIDGDILNYKVCTTNMRDTCFDGTTHLHWLDDATAKAAVRAALDYYIKKFDTEKIIIALSDSENFRNSVYPQYKSSRKNLTKPPGFVAVRDYIKEQHKFVQKPKIEADDVLGILATHPDIVQGEKVIISIDKDFKQIPGTLFNSDKKELYAITKEEADYYFWQQTLTGDTTDGYPGCPKIGEKTVQKLLGKGLTEENAWSIIVGQFIKAGKSEEFALQMARCARILRAEDYNFEKGEPILWKPKQAV